MRVVLDTNIWVSAWLWGGVPSKLLQMSQSGRIIIFASNELLQELEITLNKKKIQKKIQFLSSTTNSILSKTRELIEPCRLDLEAILTPVPQLRDLDDAVVIATAKAAQATVIITGDRDLLILGEVEGIVIFKPRDFLDRYFPD